MYAQDLQMVDSLTRELDGKSGIAKSEILRDLAFEYVDKDNLRALRYAEQAYEAIRGVPVDSLWFVKVTRLKGQLLARLERYEDVINSIQISLDVARRNSYVEEYETLLSTLALAYFYFGRYDKSILLHLECLRSREASRSVDLIVSYNNIGLLYYKLEDYGRALAYYQKALGVVGGDSAKMVGLHSNVSLCYNYLGEYDVALEHAQTGMRYCAGRCDDILVMEGELALGLIYYEMHSDSLAKISLRRSYEVAKKISNQRFQAEALVGLGRLANDDSKFGEAERYLQEAVADARRSGVKSMIEQSYFELFRSVAGQGRLKEAVECWDKSRAVGDSLFGERAMNTLFIAQVDFDQENNRIKLALQDSIAAGQRKQNIAVVITGCLLTIVVGIIFFSFQERRRENNVLELEVHKRTTALAQKVHALKHEETERRDWEEKIDKSLREGNVRIEALGEMVAHAKIKTALRNFNGGQASDRLKASVEKEPGNKR